ncbi:MAG: VWA domain-containing protein, partial [Thermomicrobiaceae bacterium]|nr:VWA domain-containing protein [Thermomicrobiaceae bacterium]
MRDPHPFAFRYSRWDGTQRIDPFDADEILEAISDDVLADGDLSRALQRLFRWGWDRPDGQQMPGMRDLLERVRQMREREQRRYDLGSILDDINRRLDEIVETERRGIERRLEEGRRRLEQQRARSDSSPAQSERGEGEGESEGEGDEGAYDESLQ